ncbi:hypothetical protein [Bacteroides fragilis]|uniref:hypothetical protein n=1 Tax=Bacteroides fragilis TaxID=817 RepID=UPI002030C76D|nr:hypothetical protein [Bacteroides fragilis]
MEKSNWNIDQMLHWLDIKIERENRDIARLEKQMDGDFLYYLEWKCGEPVQIPLYVRLL